MYRCLIIILTLGIHANLMSQEVRNFQYYDEHSLELYNAGQWQQLIPLGKDAFEQGHDFYYLRMRVGIAYYNLEKYKLAINQFENALSFNSDDPLALEYLYYSYLFSGHEADALALYQKKKEFLVNIDSKSQKLIKGIYSEAGYKFSNNQVSEVGDIRFLHVGLSHQLAAGFNIYHGYTRLTQGFSEFTEVRTGNATGPGGGGTSRLEKKISYTQNEYYIRGTIRPASRWLLIPAYHYQAFVDSLDNHAFSFGLTKDVGIARFYTAVGFSHINQLDQHQWTLGITLYPMANLDFYIQTNFTLHDQEQEQNNILFHKIGGKIMNNTWIEASFGWGDMYNYSEMDAFYVQNIPDLIDTKLGITLIQIINQKHRLLTGYALENKKQLETGNGYRHHTFFAGLNILF